MENDKIAPPDAESSVGAEPEAGTPGPAEPPQPAAVPAGEGESGAAAGAATAAAEHARVAKAVQEGHLVRGADGKLDEASLDKFLREGYDRKVDQQGQLIGMRERELAELKARVAELTQGPAPVKPKSPFSAEPAPSTNWWEAQEGQLAGMAKPALDDFVQNPLGFLQRTQLPMVRALKTEIKAELAAERDEWFKKTVDSASTEEQQAIMVEDAKKHSLDARLQGAIAGIMALEGKPYPVALAEALEMQKTLKAATARPIPAGASVRGATGQIASVPGEEVQGLDGKAFKDALRRRLLAGAT